MIPIPNFVPSYNMGLPGAIRESLNALGYGMRAAVGMAGPLTLAQNEGSSQRAADDRAAVLAQFNRKSWPGGMSNLMPNRRDAGAADRQPVRAAWAAASRPTSTALIDLITTTIAPAKLGRQSAVRARSRASTRT